MSIFIGSILLISSIALVAFSLYKKEEQYQALQHKISVAQEKFTNK